MAIGVLIESLLGDPTCLLLNQAIRVVAIEKAVELGSG